MRNLALALLPLFLVATPLSAAPAPVASEAPKLPEKVRVAISPFAPFVMKDGARARGYSIDLWERIASRLGLAYEYVEAKGVPQKLDKLLKGDADVAIGGITFTHERERIVDFTHPTFESGLGILVRERSADAGFFEKLKGAFSKTRLSIIFGFLLLIIAAGHLIWIAERGKEAFDDRYVPGVFEGMYWAIVTASTVGYGDKAPVKWSGRVLACLLIVISLPMFAVFTAELASALTIEEIQSQIRGPDDLRGKRIGVRRGTSSAAWAARSGLRLLQWDEMEDVYAALLEGRVDAVVYDAPALAHFAQGPGRGKVYLVGEPFLRQDLGMALPEKSPLREQVNRVLLELKEEGELQRLRVKWMGAD